MTDNPFSVPESSEAGPPQRTSVVYSVLKLFGLAIVGLVVLAMLLPFNRGRHVAEAARRTQCRNNLKQIGLALYNYHDVYQSLPPAYTVDAAGKPLHSWRTLILPYLEQQALYRTIDLSRPWNDPVNRIALETNIETYRCPSSKTPVNHTTYLGVSSPESVFFEAEARQLSSIEDGTPNTLMVVEVAQDLAVPWMSPQDAVALLQNVDEQSDFAHTGGFQATLADGSVRFISSTIDTDMLRALTTINGGETVGEF